MQATQLIDIATLQHFPLPVRITVTEDGGEKVKAAHRFSAVLAVGGVCLGDAQAASPTNAIVGLGALFCERITREALVAGLLRIYADNNLTFTLELFDGRNRPHIDPNQPFYASLIGPDGLKIPVASKSAASLTQAVVALVKELLGPAVHSSVLLQWVVACLDPIIFDAIYPN